MSVKIWDSASGAFAEPVSVPKRYDTASEAWVDTTGYAHDPEAEAWTERWDKKRITLYDHGKIKAGFEWNIDFTVDKNGLNTWNNNMPTKMSMSTDSIQFNINAMRTMNICFSQKIDFTDLDKIYARVEVEYNGGATTPVYFCVVSNTEISFGSSEIIASAEIREVGEHTLELDVSSISGEAYIRLQAQNSSSSVVYQNVGRYTEIYAQKK